MRGKKDVEEWKWESIFCAEMMVGKRLAASENRLQLKNYRLFNVPGVFQACGGVELKLEK